MRLLVPVPAPPPRRAGAFVMTADRETRFAEAILNKLVREIAWQGPTGAPRQAAR